MVDIQMISQEGVTVENWNNSPDMILYISFLEK